MSPIVRGGLVVLGVGQGATALLALFAPRTFFDDFPVPGADWVSAFAPFNEHFVRDYGASFLAIATLALIAAWLADRRLVVVTLAVWLIAAVPHAIVHFANADKPGGSSGAANLATLTFNVLLPLILLYLVRKEDTP